MEGVSTVEEFSWAIFTLHGAGSCYGVADGHRRYECVTTSSTEDPLHTQHISTICVFRNGEKVLTNHVIVRASDVAVMWGHTDLCHPHSASTQAGPSSYTTLFILPQSRLDRRFIHKCLPHD
ncbi:hypothetical protein J4Q44_G00154180 [Coregonus suidteri]|uniref:Uncharacterized protein n=1 Tax=Coregonus suidteri TaxID=861788 RepID=A0AAN8LQ45_9TELE